MQQAKSSLMSSARSSSRPSPGTSLGAMATPCFQMLEESSSQHCMGAISGRPPFPPLPKSEDTLSNAGQGWVEGGQGVCQGGCCPAQMELSPRTAPSKDEAQEGTLCPRDAGRHQQRFQVFSHHRGSVAEEGAPFGGQYGQGSASC